MRTASYNNVLRIAALCLAATLMTPAIQAQEALHLFYKYKERQTIEITPDTKVEFYKKPYVRASWNGNEPDTIHFTASSGRSHELGYVYYNTGWEISTDDEWLLTRKGEIIHHEGDGILCNYFIVYAQRNETDQHREGRVTVSSAAAGVTKDFVVIQHPYMLTLGQDHFYGDHDAAVLTQEVELAWNDTIYYTLAYPNHGVNLVSYPSWMELVYKTDGDDYCQFEDIMKEPSAQHAGDNKDTHAGFRFAINETPDERTGNIVFEAYGKTATINITQKGLTEDVIAEESDILGKLMYQFDMMGQQSHDDFGFPSLMISMESRGIDMVSFDHGYNWFSTELTYQDLNSKYRQTARNWNSMYNQVNTANQIISDYGARADQSLFQYYLAQAYAFRAFNYFYLAQLYQHTYMGNEEAPCVPIITEDNMHSIHTEGCARATVREVYDFILNDLEKSLELLQLTAMKRSEKQLISPTVIYGLRARIYMVMNKWEEALADANSVISTSGATPYTREEVSKPTFDDINHNAWIWGVDVKETDRAVTSGICNWPSHMGSFTYGYAVFGGYRTVSQTLYNAIPSTDARKGWFINEEYTSPNINEEHINYLKTYNMPAYTQVKFAPYKNEVGTSVNASDIPLMRIEEMYLIVAEAQVMTGKVDEARNTLNNFVSTYRDPAYQCNANTAEEMLEAVWMQRRIELWGEGHSYFDLMRMKKGVDRRGAGFQPAYVFNIPAGDAALIYPIPNGEMTRNKLLIQNPEASAPTPVSE